MSTTHRPSDTIVLGVILSIFLAMGGFMVLAGFTISGLRSTEDAARAEVAATRVKKRDAELTAIASYSVAYTATGTVDTAKGVSIPVSRAEDLVLRERQSTDLASPRRTLENASAARAAFPAGAALFARDCASCHGPSAEGGAIGTVLSEYIRAYQKVRPLTPARVGDQVRLVGFLTSHQHRPVFGQYSGIQWGQLHAFVLALVREGV